MRRIKLTQGKYTTVDDCDYGYLMQWSWHFRNGYAMSNQNYKRVRMHRIIAKRMGLLLPKQLDHKNRNKLDNRRRNFRPATSSQNKANQELLRTNTTGYKGVSKQGNRYRATIQINGRQLRLGWFTTAEEAAAAYDSKAKIVFGEYACLNDVNCIANDPRGTWSSNKSGYRGVSWKHQTKRWVATITVNQKSIHLGYFDDKVKAAKKWNKAARKYFGRTAYQNSI